MVLGLQGTATGLLRVIAKRLVMTDLMNLFTTNTEIVSWLIFNQQPAQSIIASNSSLGYSDVARI